MRVKIIDDVPEGRLFGDMGPGAGEVGDCFYLTIKDDHFFAHCMFDDWEGIFVLELGWLLHESEEGMTTYAV